MNTNYYYKMQANMGIEALEALGGYTDLVDILKTATIRKKPFWMPFFDSSMAPHPKRIYLAKNWLAWPDIAQRANLLHEACHCRDQIQMGLTKWYFAYARKSSRLDLEKSGFAMELNYYCRIGDIADPINTNNSQLWIRLNPRVKQIVAHLRDDYYLGSSIEENDLYEWCLSIVNRYYGR